MYKRLQKVATLTLQMHMLQCGLDLGSPVGQAVERDKIQHNQRACTEETLNFILFFI